MNKLLVVPKFKLPKFKPLAAPEPLTWQLEINIRLDVICPVTVVAALRLEAIARPSAQTPNRETSTCMVSILLSYQSSVTVNVSV